MCSMFKMLGMRRTPDVQPVQDVGYVENARYAVCSGCWVCGECQMCSLFRMLGRRRIPYVQSVQNAEQMQNARCALCSEYQEDRDFKMCGFFRVLGRRLSRRMQSDFASGIESLEDMLSVRSRWEQECARCAEHLWWFGDTSGSDMLVARSSGQDGLANMIKLTLVRQKVRAMLLASLARHFTWIAASA